MIKPNDVFQIGRIGKPHGVKGEVTFHFTDDIFDRTDSEYLILEVDGILVPFFMEEYRFRSDTTALVTFCDISTQEQARQLTGSDVYFLRSEVPDDDDGELSWAQVVGFSIIDAATAPSPAPSSTTATTATIATAHAPAIAPAHAPVATAPGRSTAEAPAHAPAEARRSTSPATVGTIVAVDDSTINTLFEILTPDGRRVLLPASDDLITDVDTAARTITLVIPDGLLEL